MLENGPQIDRKSLTASVPGKLKDFVYQLAKQLGTTPSNLVRGWVEIATGWNQEALRQSTEAVERARAIVDAQIKEYRQLKEMSKDLSDINTVTEFGIKHPELGRRAMGA